MKFGKNLERHMTSEWRNQYINYAELNLMIRRGVENAPNPNTAPRILVTDYYRQFEHEFFSTCVEELNRVELFYAEKLAEARRKHATFRVKLRSFSQRQEGGGRSSRMPFLAPQQPESGRKLRSAYCEFYLSLILLKNYQSLNITAFHKICKKYDKYLRSNEGGNWFGNVVSISPFTEEYALSNMISEVEDWYTRYLAGGDRSKAMSKLRVPPLGQPAPPSQVFCAGLFLGLFIVGAVMCVLSYLASISKHQLLFAFAQLYRGPIVWVLFCFYLAINVNIWNAFGINHTLIFEIDPRNHLQSATMLQVASIVGYICALSILAFLHHDIFGIEDPYLFPIACIVITLALLFNPLRIMNYPARMWFICLMGRTVTAPFHYVSFSDFWMADQMNSLVMCIVDHYMLCRFYAKYYSHKENAFDFEPDLVTSILRCVPAWLRFAQSLRRYRDSSSKSNTYLVNAIKYSWTFAVVYFSYMQMEKNAQYKNMFDNPWTWFFILASLVDTIYCTYWDLALDFGLFKIWRGENIFLREQLIYPKWFYYFVIIENTLARSFWALEVYLVYYDYVLPYNCKTMALLCEVTRRFIWNLIRLENEHLYNCGQFRATRDIFIGVPDSAEQLQIDALVKASQSTSHGDRRALNKKYF